MAAGSAYVPRVLITVANDLSRLDVYADTPLEQTGILGMREPAFEPVGVITDYEPVLLTDNHRIAQAAPHIRDTVFSLYQSYPRTVRYDDVEVAWSPFDFPRVWCPSIDTVFLARALKEELGGVRTFAEIGTGSGFLTKYALVHGASTVKRAVATDIAIDAIRCAHAATAGLANRDKLSLLNIDSNSTLLGLSGTYDLIVSNPPYIPRPNENHDNPYEGLDLIAKLADAAEELLNRDGRILLNVSSVAGDNWQTWFADSGFTVSAGAELRVPLKVNAITCQISNESQDWISYLIDNELVECESDYGDASGYRFWHRLRIFTIERSAE